MKKKNPWTEIADLLKFAGSLPSPAKPARKISRKTRLAGLEKALASDDALGRIRQLIPDDGENEQAVLIYAHACILETNSAGLSIVFDRFDPEELDRIEKSLHAIKASKTLLAFRQLRRLFSSEIKAGRNAVDAGEWMAAKPAVRRIDKNSGALVAEMERKLLAFCRSHVEQLAAE